MIAEDMPAPPGSAITVAGGLMQGAAVADSAIGARAALATANIKDFPMPEVEVQYWAS